MKTRILIILFSIIVFQQIVFAKEIGTTMFQILQLPVSAYDASLANTAACDDVSALSNPSLIPFLSRSLILTHAVYLQDMRYSVGNINIPVNTKSGINFSFCYFDSGSIERTMEMNDGYVYNGDFKVNDKVFNLSYGTRLGNSFSLGFTVKFIEQSIDDVSYSNFLVGLSGLYFISNTVFVTAGIKDLGSQVKGYSMPTDIFCSLTGNLNETVIGIVQVDNYINENLNELKLAFEKKVNTFSVRLGYVITNKNYGGTNEDFINNLTLGAGLDFKVVVIDYAWLPKGDLGNVQMFTVRIKF